MKHPKKIVELKNKLKTNAIIKNRKDNLNDILWNFAVTYSKNKSGIK
jgi:hypothetical protein